jgi:hypothetical protein
MYLSINVHIYKMKCSSYVKINSFIQKINIMNLRKYHVFTIIFHVCPKLCSYTFKNVCVFSQKDTKNEKGENKTKMKR